MTKTPYKVEIEYTGETGAVKTYSRIITATSPAVALRRILKFAPTIVSANYRDAVISEESHDPQA